MCPTHKNPNAIFKRQIEAKQRSEAFAKLSPEEKMAELDMRLGVDIGARRQRVKLMAEILTKAFLSAEAKGVPAPSFNEAMHKGIPTGRLTMIMGKAKAGK